MVGFPDVPGALQMLLANNIRVGLITTPTSRCGCGDRELQAYGLLHLFSECRFTAADVGWLKPHPRIFEAALECLGVQPEEAVFVGDNPVADVAGAQNVGMRGVLRVGRHETGMLEGLIEPDHRLHSFEELPAVLDNWFPGWRS